MRRRSPATLTSIALAALVGAAALVGCSHPTGSKAKFCAQVRKVPALESVLAHFSETDPDVLNDRITKARAAYDQLTEDAPSAIDVQTDQVVKLVDDILDAVEQHPTDPAKAAAQLRKAVAVDKQVGAARTKVAAYAKTECGVQLDATLTDSPTTTTAPVGGSTTTAPPTSGSTTTTG
ncbi:hypothetical protein [Aquihabitans sp. McL0605]|uniref:hypothetical protein n=1 Tax=Aquihabitans sp. McL0605 TaxID=3415671 RepID=UPI003CF3EA6F